MVLLSLPALSVNGALGSGTREDKIDTLYASIEAWEDIMAICKRTQASTRCTRKTICRPARTSAA